MRRVILRPDASWAASRAVALTPKEETFCARLAQHGNATRAYREAFDPSGLTYQSLRQTAYQLAHEPHIEARFYQLLDEAAGNAVVSISARMTELQRIVFGDRGEVEALTTGACRRCWGKDFGHHWLDEDEHTAAVAAAFDRAAASGKRFRMPSNAGGYGYQADRSPNPLCPSCRGEGLQRLVLTPTDQLSPSARAMVKGYTVRSNGSIGVEYHSKLTALDLLNRMQPGVYERHAVNVNINAAAAAVDFSRMSNAEAADFLASLRGEPPIIEGEVTP
jgi:phage terminase small subunit